MAKSVAAVDGDAGTRTDRRDGTQEIPPAYAVPQNHRRMPGTVCHGPPSAGDLSREGFPAQISGPKRLCYILVAAT
ncbi:hypothetical protein MPRF_26700 [Mycolicibacterium parafortuitum]|uniref:Uncharacterized protein n=1 Tax=Mycolicibacterium parafortuitum TaxID=39692 RepID=A0A7I7U4D9_MYCPF|nr:hypothetical protein MPRF_26700 [Mycolicibacterium parafortuitum]